MTPDQLADAKAKYHLLVTGQAPRVVVDGNNGDRVEFQGANTAGLLEYIRAYDPTFLQPVNPAVRISRPFGFVF